MTVIPRLIARLRDALLAPRSTPRSEPMPLFALLARPVPSALDRRPRD